MYINTHRCSELVQNKTRLGFRAPEKMNLASRRESGKRDQLQSEFSRFNP
jgi:hypothetical protein